MCSARRLIVLYINVKFRENISNCFQLTKRTRVHGRNGYVQWAITPKVGKPELQYVFCTSSHGAIYFVKISLTVSIMELTRMMEVLTDRLTLKILDSIT